MSMMNRPDTMFQVSLMSEITARPPPKFLLPGQTFENMRKEIVVPNPDDRVVH